MTLLLPRKLLPAPASSIAALEPLHPTAITHLGGIDGAIGVDRHAMHPFEVTGHVTWPAEAGKFLSNKPAIENVQDSLWTFSELPAFKPAPDREAFEYIIRKKGIDEAISVVKSTIKEDTTTDIMKWFILNSLGYNFMGEQKYKEAVGVFKLNTELHPDDPNLFDSLAEAYEQSGDTENMKKTSAIVMEILNKKTTLTDAEKGLKSNAERRLK